MSYMDESLAANETLLYRARFHWLQKIGAWITLALFVSGAAGFLAVGQGFAGLAVATALCLVGFGVFVSMMMPMWTTEIGVTSQRFIYKRGWLRRTTDELQLTCIEEVNLDQGALGRVFDFGRLDLHGTGVNDIQLPTLADPVGLRRALQEAMGGAKTVVVTPESVSAAPATPDSAAA